MLTGKIKGWDGQTLTIEADFSDAYLMEQRKPEECEVRLIDSRIINADQRKKSYALMRDIGLYTGYMPDEIKAIMKYDFLSRTGLPYFSLSNVDRSTAREFITHLIDFCLEWGVPCRDALLELTDDIGKYLYLCLYHRKCCICGQEAEVHHVDRVGMGRNRDEICHVGMRAMALCRGHHEQAHLRPDFEKIYHVYGIKPDGLLVRRLGLGKRSREVV